MEKKKISFESQSLNDIKIDSQDEEEEEEQVIEQFQLVRKKAKCFWVVKILLIIVNIFVLVLGVTVFMMAIWILNNPSYRLKFVAPFHHRNFTIVLTVAGLLTAATCSLGFLGIWEEMKLVIIGYFVLMSISFFIMFIGAIMAYAFRDRVVARMRRDMINTISLYDFVLDVTRAWDYVHNQFKCCGMKTNDYDEGWRVWLAFNPKIFNINTVLVPATCCVQQEDTPLNACQSRPNKGNVYMKDCSEELKSYIRERSFLAGAVSICLSFLLVLALMLTCSYLIKLNE